jgi:hypothetical protein
MHNITLNLVVSVFSTEKQDRLFLSSISDYYVPLSMTIDNSHINDSLNDCLDKIILSHTNIKPGYQLSYNLLSLKKKELDIDINYAVMLPINTEIKGGGVHLLSYNIAVVNPLARKAMAHV